MSMYKVRVVEYWEYYVEADSAEKAIDAYKEEGMEFGESVGEIIDPNAELVGN